MSWKTRLRQKRFSILLLIALFISLAVNTYGYITLLNTQLGSGGQVDVVLEAARSLCFQLDDQTDVWLYANTNWNMTNIWYSVTDEQGSLMFKSTSASVNIYWHGNVSSVEDDGIPAVNYTNHVYDGDAYFHYITWNWISAYVIPPPSTYALSVMSKDTATAVQFTDLNLTMITNSTFSETITTTYTDYVDSNTFYTFTYPSIWALNDTHEYSFDYLLYYEWDGAAWELISNSTEQTLTLMPEEATLVQGYYSIVEIEIIVPLVPIVFIIGMAGLGCMFFGPILAITLLRQKEYQKALTWGAIITIAGLALFMSWLWH